MQHQHKILTEDDVATLGKLFSTPLGKRSMAILDRVFYNTISFASDAETTAFNEGHRDIIQFFHNAVNKLEEEE